MKKTEIEILIIEDDLVLAENLREGLKVLGYQKISVCSNKLKLEKYLSEQQPDVVFTDINLGKYAKETGIELVKQNKLYRNAAIIILSSYTDELYREQAKEIHADAYLVKPSSEAQIEVTIDLAMSHRYNARIEKPKQNTPSYPLLTGNDFIFMRNNSRFEKLHLSDIIIVKADGSYFQICSTYKDTIQSGTMGGFIEQLSAPRIIRCHRSYAVNVDYISSFDDNKLYVNRGREVLEIPLGDAYKEDLFKYLPKFVR